MRNWNFREFSVQVNLPSRIWQVGVLIRQVITPIQGLLNPIRQVILLISHIFSYPPYRSYLHPPSLSVSSTLLPSSQEHKVKSSLSISPCHDHELPPSASYTECIIYRVHHTLSASYTGCIIHWVHHTPSASYTECIIHRVHHTPSASYTECIIHRVHHTPSAEYTERRIHWVEPTPEILCHPFILTSTSWPLNVALASSEPHYRSTATIQFSIRASKVMSPCHIPTVSS